MAFTKNQIRNIESSLTIWLALRRPPEKIRDKLDFGYSIKGQDIFLEEIRPIFRKPEELGRYPFAKIKYVKSNELWKIYWLRGNLKWHSYAPRPIVEELEVALEEIMKDSHHCFFG